MDIHHLKIFAAIYENRSFSKAAKCLNLSQPTVSAHMKTLEKELDCSLFDRLGKKIMPTAEGQVLLPMAQQVIESLTRLEEELSQVKGRLDGRIMVGASTIPGTYIMPAMMAAFQKQHPHVSFEISISDSRLTTEKILSHDLLLGIVGARMSKDNLEYTALYDDELLLVATPELAARYASLDPAELLTRLPILIREYGSGTRKVMENYLGLLHLDSSKMNIAAVLGTSSSIKEATLVGLGAAMLSRMAVRKELATNELVEITLPDTPIKRNFYLVRHKKRTLPSHYQALFDFLIARNTL